MSSTSRQDRRVAVTTETARAACLRRDGHGREGQLRAQREDADAAASRRAWASGPSAAPACAPAAATRARTTGRALRRSSTSTSAPAQANPESCALAAARAPWKPVRVDVADAPRAVSGNVPAAPSLPFVPGLHDAIAVCPLPPLLVMPAAVPPPPSPPTVPFVPSASKSATDVHHVAHVEAHVLPRIASGVSHRAAHVVGAVTASGSRWRGHLDPDPVPDLRPSQPRPLRQRARA